MLNSYPRSPYNSPIFKNENVVYRIFPLQGDGTQQNKLKIASLGLSSGQTWGWDGTQWAAYSLGGSAALPSQTGNAGKFLTTDGTNASWSAALAIAASKILTVSNTLTLTGTDGSTINAGTGGTIAYTDVANTFTQNQIFNLPTLTGSSATNGIQINQTWNTTGAPNLIYGNVTNTASNVSSNLIKLDVSGTQRLSISSTGLFTLGDVALNNFVLGRVLTQTYSHSSVGAYPYITSSFQRDWPNYGFTVSAPTMNFNATPAGASTAPAGILNLQGNFLTAFTGSQIDFRPVNVAYTINNTSATARTATGIFLNATETALNGMTHNLMDLQAGGASRFRVTNTGDAYVSAGIFRGSNQVLFTASGNEGLTLRDNVGTVRVALSTNNNSYLTGGNLLLGTNTGTTANLNIATPSAVSYSAILTSGTWFTGGTSTTTKPHVLIEPAGTTSTAWSTAGTGLGINAASGFGGNLLDLQVNGVSRMRYFSDVNTLQPTLQVLSPSGQVNAGFSRFGGVIASSAIVFGTAGATMSLDGSRIYGNTNGIIRLTNSSEADFERLTFGGSGTTSASPALQTASSNAQASLAATFTNGSANIGTATNTYAVNDVVRFTTTSALPTGFTAGTNYFVVGTPTSTVIQVSATQGGTAITAGSAGSGTHTVTRQTLAVFTNGSATVTTSVAHGLRVGDVIRFSNSGGSLPSSISSSADYYVLTIPTTTTFTYSASFGGTAIIPPETALTATFSGTPNITTTTNSYIVDSVVRFSTTGTLPTGLSTGTDYYVIASGLTTTNIQVSATLGGTAISYTGTGSGTHTVTRQILGNGIHFATRSPGLYVRTSDNSATAALYAGNIVANAPTGYTGRVFDLRVGTSAVLNVDQVGNTVIGGGLTTSGGISAGSGQSLSFSTRSVLRSSLDGDFTVTNNTGNSFGLFKLGGITSSFPAHKRNGTTIETVLADDSGFAATQSLYQRFGAGSPEGVVTAPVGATYNRTDGSAGTSFYVKESGTGNTGWVQK